MPTTTREQAARPVKAQMVERLVDATIRLLATEGPSEIKARTVAEAAQVSASAVYYHVGGLPELFQAVVERGFVQLGRAFGSAPPCDDAVADLFVMALATRRLAQGNPHLYDLMFGLSTRGSYRPSEPRLEGGPSSAFQAAHAHLVRASARLTRTGRIRGDLAPGLVADQLWSCVHGFVTLELGGYFTHHSDPVRQVLLPMTLNLFVGMGDHADLAHRSHVSVLDQ